MRKIVDAWLSAAYEDLVLARKAFELAIYRQTCFHAQQAIEKGFKAILLEKGAKPKKIHDLLELSGDLETSGVHVPISLPDLDFVNRVYRFRYPPDTGLLPHGQPTREDAQKALAIAENTMDWIQQLLGRKEAP